MEPQFTIYGLPEGESDLLGIWQSAPPSSTDDLSFSATESTEEEEVTWSVVLPDDYQMARTLLTIQTANVRVMRQRHQTAQRQLTAISMVESAEMDSFSFAAAAESPEGQLQRQLSFLHRQAEGEVSFSGADAEDEADWFDTVRQYQATMQQIFQLLKPSLTTETALGGHKIAISRVGVTGSIDTVWSNRTVEMQRRLHQRTVNLSLESRVALLQLVGQITVGAAVLAAKFNMPGGQLWALPAAWRYIRDVSRQTGTVLAKNQALSQLRST